MQVKLLLFFFQNNNNSNTCSGERALCTNESCSLKFVDVKCDPRRRHFRHLASSDQRSQQLMSAEFEMNVRPTNPTGSPLIYIVINQSMCGVVG